MHTYNIFRRADDSKRCTICMRTFGKGDYGRALIPSELRTMR